MSRSGRTWERAELKKRDGVRWTDVLRAREKIFLNMWSVNLKWDNKHEIVMSLRLCMSSLWHMNFRERYPSTWSSEEYQIRRREYTESTWTIPTRIMTVHSHLMVYCRVKIQWKSKFASISVHFLSIDHQRFVHISGLILQLTNNTQWIECIWYVDFPFYTPIWLIMWLIIWTSILILWSHLNHQDLHQCKWY